MRGAAKIADAEKMVVARNDTFKEVLFKPAATNNTGAGCVIEDIPETDENAAAMETCNNIISSGGMSMTNIILKQSDGEDGIEDVAIDLCNSPIKDAAGWADAPEGAKEFYVVTSDGSGSPSLPDFEK